MHKFFDPKIITVFKEGYSLKKFSSDLIAGLIVSIVALPLAIAFAIASGVKPEQGLYTAVVAGFTISALGGTRTQVSGPTGAFIVVIYGIVQKYGYDGLAVATLIAGIMLVIMGLANVGVLLKFIPYPVTVGFTSGIALIIFSSQIRDFFGLQMESVPAGFIEKWIAFARHGQSFNKYAIGVGLLSLLIIFLWPRITHKIPGPLIAILVVTTLVTIFKLPVDTIGSRFGNVPSTLPVPSLPQINWKQLPELFSPAMTIAFLGALESLLAAVVADGMLGTRHRSNTELVALGFGNILSPIFKGIPATGAIARTATNIKNGGRTPVAGMVHAVMLLVIMLFFGRWARLIPMPTLAAILIFVAYNMSERHAFVKLLRSPKSDVAVLLTTFLLTVLVDLTVAIQVGVVMASLLFLQRMSNATQISLITKDLQSEDIEEDRPDIPKRPVPADVEVFEIYGSLFFGAIERFKDAMRRVEEKPKVLILRMRGVVAIDATGLQTLEDLLSRTRREGTSLILSGVHSQPFKAMQLSGFLAKIGQENVLDNFDSALARADSVLQYPPDDQRLTERSLHH